MTCGYSRPYPFRARHARVGPARRPQAMFASSPYGLLGKLAWGAIQGWVNSQ